MLIQKNGYESGGMNVERKRVRMNQMRKYMIYLAQMKHQERAEERAREPRRLAE